jgi:predicted DNA-binding transcriptional regulator AlpA
MVKTKAGDDVVAIKIPTEIEADEYGRVILSVEECAKSLGMSETSFWRARKRGEIVAIKLGPRAVGVSVAERNRFLRARSAA